MWADSSGGPALASSAVHQFTVRASGGVRFFSNAAATSGVQLAPGGNAFAPISDRNVKENFSSVEPRQVLEKLIALPVTFWNLKSQDASIRHIGPTAQDFQGAFGVGEYETHISTSDADGVALAAIQGLYELVREKDKEITDVKARLAALEAVVQRLASQPKGDSQ